MCKAPHARTSHTCYSSGAGFHNTITHFSLLCCCATLCYSGTWSIRATTVWSSTTTPALPSTVISNFQPALLYAWNCVVDAAGNLYVSNTGTFGVNVANANGSQIAYYMLPTIYPNQIAIDTSNNLYVADSNEYVIKKFNLTTAPLTPAGQNLTTIGTFQLPTGSFPNGVAVDTAGNVYASDTTQQSVYIFGSNAAVIKVLAMPNYTLPLNNPRGMAVDPSGNIYVMLTAHIRFARSEWHRSTLHTQSLAHSPAITAVVFVCHLGRRR